MTLSEMGDAALPGSLRGHTLFVAPVPHRWLRQSIRHRTGGLYPLYPGLTFLPHVYA
jgi:hypothetical protein